LFLVFRLKDYAIFIIVKKSFLLPFKALELQPSDKNCLVCRSKCHLQLGDTATALEDAELSLADDNTFHKVIIRKSLM
jgi:hypothetical protein